jgi:hypothetical protein
MNYLSLIAIGVLLVACSREDPDLLVQRMVVDDAVIDSGDPWSVIEPLWWEGDIYGTHATYLTSLEGFTDPQRFVYALIWYQSEVNNGGHGQFFDNSTGIVWEDALRGAELIGSPETSEILKEAVKRLGGKPSFDREQRREQLEKNEPDFDDLDDRFYAHERSREQAMIDFISANRAEFYFEGEVSRPPPLPRP